MNILQHLNRKTQCQSSFFNIETTFYKFHTKPGNILESLTNMKVRLCSKKKNFEIHNIDVGSSEFLVYMFVCLIFVGESIASSGEYAHDDLIG